ncbi:MAG: M42 family metallopeptidase [Clostridia bacterium]|nr:M42 family metallopeptidase [Clostridia bacterium]
MTEKAMKKNAFIFDEKYCVDTFRLLTETDSTTGYCEPIQSVLRKLLEDLDCPYIQTRKGGIIADLGGEGNSLCVTAHLDDIGLMVRKINPDGTLNVCPVGGLHADYAMMENVRIRTRDGSCFTGSVCRTPGSVHVTENELKEPADYRKNVCVLLDLDVASPSDVQAYGITTGDIVALEPRFTRSGGYLKSHFVDDKAAVAILLTVIRALKQSGASLSRHVYFYFACYEEIGHGTAWLPDGICDMIAVDIAPTGPDQTSDEHKVTIFCKDSRFPYHWELTNELRKTAVDAGINFVMDIFTPHYGTDCDGSIVAGHDIRHAAIGFGCANSHGYERTHVDGLRNTYSLLLAYLML